MTKKIFAGIFALMISIYTANFMYQNGARKIFCSQTGCIEMKGNWKTLQSFPEKQTVVAYKMGFFGQMENVLEIYFIEKNAPLLDIMKRAFVPRENFSWGTAGVIDNSAKEILEKNYKNIFDGKIYIPQKGAWITCQQSDCLQSILNISNR